MKKADITNFMGSTTIRLFNFNLNITAAKWNLGLIFYYVDLEKELNSFTGIYPFAFIISGGYAKMLPGHYGSGLWFTIGGKVNCNGDEEIGRTFKKIFPRLIQPNDGR